MLTIRGVLIWSSGRCETLHVGSYSLGLFDGINGAVEKTGELETGGIAVERRAKVAHQIAEVTWLNGYIVTWGD